MNESPAKALARCKVQHPRWRIERVDGPDWSWYVATRAPARISSDEAVVEQIKCATVPQLEVELAGR
jgi:hypothetical protein